MNTRSYYLKSTALQQKLCTRNLKPQNTDLTKFKIMARATRIDVLRDLRDQLLHNDTLRSCFHITLRSYDSMEQSINEVDFNLFEEGRYDLQRSSRWWVRVRVQRDTIGEALGQNEHAVNAARQALTLQVARAPVSTRSRLAGWREFERVERDG